MTQAVVKLSDGVDGILLCARSPKGNYAAINLNELGGFIGDTFVEWAQSRIDQHFNQMAYLVTPSVDQVLAAANSETLTDKEIDRVYTALSNGCGEIPYAVTDTIELEAGEFDYCGISIRVADDQEMVYVHPICDPKGYEQEIAFAVCNAGKAIAQLRTEKQELLDKVHQLADQIWQGLLDKPQAADALYELAGVKKGN